MERAIFAGYNLQPKRDELTAEVAEEILTLQPHNRAAQEIAADYTQGSPLKDSQVKLILSDLRADFYVTFYREQPDEESVLYFSLRCPRLGIHRLYSDSCQPPPPEQSNHTAENDGPLVKITQITVEVDNQRRSGVIKFSVAPDQELGENIPIDYCTS
ncbi:MAG: hypothetical protein Q7S44_01950 [bacterium]|nr:hypothetical protein [bacterium]